ncbi:MAG: hypothetical protein IPJ81_10520 [Chitinophagaceae bacterium]|nr:hypothetical protein [Chitinophagaceae bacterium]
MKKYITITTCLIASAMGLLSLHKKNRADISPAELLNAKWKVINIQYKIIDNDVNISAHDYIGSPTDYMAFTNNNKIYRLIHSVKDVVPYILISENKILCDEDTIIIKKLTDQYCTLNLRNGSKNNYTEQVINLKK